MRKTRLLSNRLYLRRRIRRSPFADCFQILVSADQLSNVSIVILEGSENEGDVAIRVRLETRNTLLTLGCSDCPI